MTGQVAGLVLAAGAGRRFGGPKALARLDGERLVDRAVRTLREGGAGPIVVVSGAADLDVPGADVIHNAQWAEGMGSSLRTGVALLAAYVVEGRPVAGVVVVLVDQPGITAGAVERVLAGVRDDAALVVATYGRVWGHPVVLGRRHWAEAAQAAVGDRGARDVLRRHAAEVTEVECGDVASAADIDTPDQLAGWVAARRSGGA